MSLILSLLIFSTNAKADCKTDPAQYWICQGDIAATTGYLVPKLMLDAIVVEANEAKRIPGLELKLKSAETTIESLEREGTALRIANRNLEVGLAVEKQRFDFGDALIGLGVGTGLTVIAGVVIFLFRPFD